MKKVIFGLILMICSTSYGQNKDSLGNVLNNIILGVLQEDQILLSDAQKNCQTNCLWDDVGFFESKKAKKNKILQKDEKLKNQLLGTFKMSIISGNDIIDKNYNYNISLSKLGSFIIRNNDFSRIIPEGIPELPIVVTGNQLNLGTNPNSGSYQVNYTTDKLFKATNDSKVSADIMEYFKTQMNYSFKLDESSRTHLNLAAGTFDNELAILYDKAGENKCNANDFLPLFDLWVLYSKDRIQPQDSIIRSFSGICYRSTKGFDLSENQTFNASVQAGYNAQFLKAQTSGDLNWSKSKNVSKSELSYKIKMFRKPILTSVPKKEDILVNWQKLSKICQVVDNTKIIPSGDKPLIIKVKFGPIASLDYINNISIDQNFTLNKMTKKFIKSLNLLNSSQNDYTYDDASKTATFSIEILRDDDFINGNPDGDNSLSENIDIRLFYDQNVIVDGSRRYLEYVYPSVPIMTERKPLISINDDENEGVIVPVKKDDYYEYKFSGTFITENNQTISNSPKPKIFQVSNFPSNVTKSNQDVLQESIKNSFFTLPGGNRFTASFKLPLSTDVFGFNMKEIDNLTMLVLLSDGRTNNIKRSMVLSIAAPKEKITFDQSNTGIIPFDDVQSLLQSLDLRKALGEDSLTFINGEDTILTKSGEKISKQTAIDEPYTFIQKIKKINKAFDVTVLPDNSKYYIKSEFISLSKINRQKMPKENSKLRNK